MNDYYVHDTACIDTPVSIGKGTKIWHFCHVMAGARIGENSILGQNTFVGGKALIGNRVKIQNNVSIYDFVILEDDVFCGPGCVFTNVINPRSFLDRKAEYKKTTIKKGVTIGANATIICGLTIGEYALIGAGALITKNVKPFALMMGIPASQKGWVSKSGMVLDKSLVCPETGEKYKIVDNNLHIED